MGLFGPLAAGPTHEPTFRACEHPQRLQARLSFLIRLDGPQMACFRVARQPVRIRGFVQSAIPLRFVVIASRRLPTGSVLILGACNKTQPARVVGETNWLIQFKFARAVSDIPAEPDEAIGGRKFLP